MLVVIWRAGIGAESRESIGDEGAKRWPTESNSVVKAANDKSSTPAICRAGDADRGIDRHRGRDYLRLRLISVSELVTNQNSSTPEVG